MVQMKIWMDGSGILGCLLTFPLEDKPVKGQLSPAVVGVPSKSKRAFRLKNLQQSTRLFVVLRLKESLLSPLTRDAFLLLSNPRAFFQLFCSLGINKRYIFLSPCLEIAKLSSVSGNFDVDRLGAALPYFRSNSILRGIYSERHLSRAMSVATKLQSHNKPVLESRAILGPGGNRDRVPERPKCKHETLTNTEKQNKALPVITESVIRDNVSVGSSCSSDSLSSNYSAKLLNPRAKFSTVKPVKVVGGSDATTTTTSPGLSVPRKRCDWITPYSDPLYIAFHDEEWGVPVHDDRKLFELLVLSQALAELTWPLILSKRDIFRKVFNDFDPSSVAQFTENEFTTLKVNAIQLLSEPKLRAIVENANQVLKIQQEFGSLSNYCWSFVNKKPIRNRFRYARQVPVKTPKAEVMSKDLIRRGFRCVGPTVVYSFMQVTGIVNDHLVSCFRHQECDANIKDEIKPRVEGLESLTAGALEKSRS